MLFNNKPIDNKEYSEDILNEGLSIYEVCRVFRGKVIFLNDNLLRLDNSIKKSNIAIDLNSLHVADQLNRLIQLENIKEGNIKILEHTNLKISLLVILCSQDQITERLHIRTCVDNKCIEFLRCV